MTRDKIEIHEGSDESDRAQSSSDEGGDESKQESVPRGKTVVFANQKKQLKKKALKEKKKLTKKDASIKHSLKMEKAKMGMVKPDITKDRDVERMLRRIATQGVVQLFNAVSERQKKLSEELEKNTKDKEKLSGSNFMVGGKEVPKIHFKKEEANDDADFHNESGVKEEEMEV